MLGLGCGSGLSLLLAAARGAQVVGLEPVPERRELAEARGLPMLAARDASAHAIVTVLDGLAASPDPLALAQSAARLTARGGHVVLATWGPRERCESAPVLALARRLADPLLRQLPDAFALSAPGALERVVLGAGLRPDGAAWCPVRSRTRTWTARSAASSPPAGSTPPWPSQARSSSARS
ncbi:class I SAM-dependent methyltransferase [Streptacidiphilus monticola]